MDTNDLGLCLSTINIGKEKMNVSVCLENKLYYYIFKMIMN